MTADGRRVATIAVVSLAQILVTVDLTVLHVAVPVLTAQLDTTTLAILWIADIYAFATAGLLITMGGVGDRIGRRRLLRIGTLGFGAASVLAAYSPSAGVLIVARALMGVAAAAILPSAGALLRAVFTEQKARSGAIGLTTGFAAAGPAAGPIIGGLLLEHFWWGSVFLINIPVVLAIAVGTHWVPESRTPGRFRIDLPSVGLSFVAMIGLVYALKGALYSGPLRPDVLLALGAGAAAAAAFIRRQHGLAEPLIDLRLFRDRAFSASVGANLVAVSTISAFALVLSQYFQLVRGESPVNAGLQFLPGSVASVVMGLLFGPVLVRLGRARAVASGLGVTAAGFVVFAELGPHSPYLEVLVAQILFGVGATLTLMVTSDTILGSAPVRRAGAATAISSTAYEFGAGLGIAVIGTIVGTVYRAELVVPPEVPPAVARQLDESFGAVAALASGLPEAVHAAVVEAAVTAFMSGIRSAMLGSAAVMVVLALASLVALRGIARTLDRPDDHTPDPTAPDPAAPEPARSDAAPHDHPEHDGTGSGASPGSSTGRGARP